IAGILYPARRLSGVPLHRVVPQERAERWTQKPDPDDPTKVKAVLEKPNEPVKWPAYVFYFKPILLLLNVIPFGIFLVLFARVLDRYAATDWSWFFCLIAAAIPNAGFVAAQYVEFGQFKLPYEAFGTEEYYWEGSLWKTPLELDAFNQHPEPYGVYLFHMTLGHHGVFSLTPIFLF